MQELFLVSIKKGILSKDDCFETYWKNDVFTNSFCRKKVWNFYEQYRKLIQIEKYYDHGINSIPYFKYLKNFMNAFH